MRRWISMAITAALLAGCGGGGGSSSFTPPVHNPGSGNGSQTTSVKLSFKVPVHTSGNAARHRDYVSYNTRGIGITVTPSQSGGSSATLLPSTVSAMRTPTWATSIAPGFPNAQPSSDTSGGVAAPSAPVLTTSATGGYLSPQTLYVKVALVTAAGETLTSNESSIAAGTSTGTGKITVTSPAGAGTVTGYNVYAGTASGQEVRFNGRPIPIGTSFDITNSSLGTQCSSAAGGATYSCTITLPMSVGYDDVQITTWDDMPTGQGYGASFPAANNLSFQNVFDQLVENNANTSFNFALSGVVSSVALGISPNSLTGGTPGNTTLTIRAIDADGNTILGTDPYVDANGNPLTINLTTNVALATPPPAPSPVTVLAPGTEYVKLTYSYPSGETAASSEAQIALPVAGSVTVTAPSNPGGTASGWNVYAASAAGAEQKINTSPLAFGTNYTFGMNNGSVSPYPGDQSGGNAPPSQAALSVNPSIVLSTTSFTTSTLASAPTSTITYSGADIAGVTFGATLSCGSSACATIDVIPAQLGITRTGNGLGVPGISINEYPVGALGLGLGRLALGHDGRMWLTEGGANAVAAVDTTGTVATYTTTYSEQQVASGPDGRVWFAGGNGSGPGLEILNTDGSVANAQSTLPFVYQGLANGNDGNMYVTGGSNVLRYTPVSGSGIVTGPTTLFSAGGGAFGDLAADNNGTIWVIDNGGHGLLGVSETTGALTTVEPFGTNDTMQGIAVDASGRIWFGDATAQSVYVYDPSASSLNSYAIGGIAKQIALGADNNIWIAAYSGGTGANEIVRVDTTNFTVNPYTSGLTPNATPYGIASGADGNLWFTETNTSKVGKLTP